MATRSIEPFPIWRHLMTPAVLFCAVFFASQVAAAENFSDTLPADTRTEKKVSQPPFIQAVTQAGDYHCRDAPKELPPWPLEPLAAGERAARLEFFFKLYDFTLQEKASFDLTKCTSLIQRLESFQDVRVLEPDYKGWFSPKKSTTCPNLTDLTMYLKVLDASLAMKPDEPAFSSLSETEKIAQSDYYNRPAKGSNLEYYDLTRYFDTSVWGVIVDGVWTSPRSGLSPVLGADVARNDNADIKLGLNAYLRSGTLVRVFEPESCKAYFLPLYTVQRLSGHSCKYSEKPAFVAFVEIDQRPYVLAVALGPSWRSFAISLKSGSRNSPKLSLTPLLAPTAVSAPVTMEASTCSYNSIKAK